MRWLLILALTFPLFSQADNANNIDYEVAFNKLKGAYTQCQTHIENRDDKIKALEQQINNFTQQQTALDSIIADLKDASKRAELLIKKQQTIITLSNEIEKKYQHNTQLCSQSMDELVSKVKELNALYNQAFKECLKPWYARWQTWAGFIAGLAIGIPL